MPATEIVFLRVSRVVVPVLEVGEFVGVLLHLAFARLGKFVEDVGSNEVRVAEGGMGSGRCWAVFQLAEVAGLFCVSVFLTGGNPWTGFVVIGSMEIFDLHFDAVQSSNEKIQVGGLSGRHRSFIFLSVGRKCEERSETAAWYIVQRSMAICLHWWWLAVDIHLATRVRVRSRRCLQGYVTLACSGENLLLRC